MAKESELFKNPEDQAGILQALESLPHKYTLNIMVAELGGDVIRKKNDSPQKKSHTQPDRESGK